MRIQPLFGAAIAAALLASAAQARSDDLGAPRGIALMNAIKTVCSQQYRVNADEVDATNAMMRGAFGQKDPRAFQAAIAVEEAKVGLEIANVGEASWCATQKTKLQAIGARRMFQ